MCMQEEEAFGLYSVLYNTRFFLYAELQQDGSQACVMCMSPIVTMILFMPVECRSNGCANLCLYEGILTIDSCRDDSCNTYILLVLLGSHLITHIFLTSYSKTSTQVLTVVLFHSTLHRWQPFVPLKWIVESCVPLNRATFVTTVVKGFSGCTVNKQCLKCQTNVSVNM